MQPDLGVSSSSLYPYLFPQPAAITSRRVTGHRQAPVAWCRMLPTISFDIAPSTRSLFHPAVGRLPLICGRAVHRPSQTFAARRGISKASAWSLASEALVDAPDDYLGRRCRVLFNLVGARPKRSCATHSRQRKRPPNPKDLAANFARRLLRSCAQAPYGALADSQPSRNLAP
jgi:hypothetical protein